MRNQLAVRIVYLSDTNRWKTTEFNWKSISTRNIVAREINPKHFEWLNDFKNICIDTDREYVYDDTVYILLDQAGSSQIFNLLDDARKLGIGLYTKINASKLNEINLDKDKAHVSINVTTKSDDSLEVETVLKHNDYIVNTSGLGFLGKNANTVYTYDINDKISHIEIYKLDTNVDSGLQENILNKKSIKIPKSEKKSFEETYLNKIQSRFQAISTDNSIEIPKAPLATLILDLKPSQNNDVFHIKLFWSYGNASNGHKYTLNSHNDDSIRNFVFEKELLSELSVAVSSIEEFFITNNFGDLLLKETVVLTGSNLIKFSNIIMPELANMDGIKVETKNEIINYEESYDLPKIEIGTSENLDGNQDWFNLDVDVKVGEHSVDFQDLFRALAQNDEYMILENGTYFSLDNEILSSLKKLIDEAKDLQEKKSDTLQISRYHASFWEELKELGIVRDQTNAWQKSIDGLLNLERIEHVDPPSELNAKLRPYQLEGYQWLCFLYENKLGAILGDDMGLGKTIQALAMIVKIFQDTKKADRKPFLVVAPTSVATNWLSEAKKFAPKLNTVLITQTAKKSDKKLIDEIKNADIVITSYTLLRIDFESYSDTKTINWSGMFLDEAQFIKNHQSKSYQCVRKISVPFKLAMTGTPIENNLMELWSLFSITSPGLFGGPKKFTDMYRKPIEKDQDKEKLDQIRRRARPLLLRRTKEQVVKELPPKIEQVLELQLNADHRKVYDLVLARERQKVLGLIEDVDRNQFTILKSLTTLRMLSLDPSLVDNEKYSHVSSTKLDSLIEQINEVVGENHRALIFSQFTSFLAKVKNRLDEEKIEYCYLDGKTKNRGDVIDKFKTSKTPLFLISLKSGGFGLNLTEADYCFLLDPWWNPAAESQAIDRTHRIGQKKQVMVYRLVAKDTIEEKVMLLKERKAKLFKSVLDDGEIFSSKLTAEDVKSLFE